MAIPADLLATLKAFLGIDPGDTSRDAWITAQAEVVLAAMRRVTGRWLYPPAAFVDLFAVPIDPHDPCHPCSCDACPPVTARETPATAVDALDLDGAAIDPAGYVFLPDGTLLDPARQPVPVPSSGVLRVTYTAGLATLPADIEAALCMLVGAAFSASGFGAPALAAPPAGVSRIQITDVGSLEFDTATGAGQVSDPILGRYTPMLAPYFDWVAQVAGHPCRQSVPA